MGSCLSSESRSPLLSFPSFGDGDGKRKKHSGRKSGSRNSSFGSQKGETPGVLSTNGVTEFASLFTQQGKKGPNQDAMTVWENFGSRPNTIFCGIFDGHGPYGHMVSSRVRDCLPQKLSAQWELNTRSVEFPADASFNSSSKSSDDTSFASADDDSSSSVDHIFPTLRESFLKAFKVMDRELKLHKTVDCFYSGTTAVTLVKQGKDLVIGNVGDSRAVLGTRDSNNSIVPVQLTVDLKPSLTAEAERIRRCRGRIFSLEYEPEVARVWLPDNDSPGLAMARAFGDFCLKDYGLIAVPEVTHRRLTENDEFVVLATDGIWDVLSNKDVVNIVDSAPSRGLAAKVLVESAVKAWKRKHPTSKVDDCAVVCLFLDQERSDNSSSTRNSTKEEEQSPSNALDDSQTRSRISPNDNVDDELSVGRDYQSTMRAEWSALEGVTRANTLVKLPRFLPEGDGKTGGETKPPL